MKSILLITVFSLFISGEILSNIPEEVQQCRANKDLECACFEELKISHPQYKSYCNFYLFNSNCFDYNPSEKIELIKSILKDWNAIDRFDYRNLYLLHETSINYAKINEIDSSILYLNKILSTPFDKNPYSAIFIRDAHVDLAHFDYRSGDFFKGLSRINNFINAKDSIYNSLDPTQKAYTHFSQGSYYLNIPYKKYESQGLQIHDSLNKAIQTSSTIHPYYIEDISSKILFEKVRVLSNQEEYAEALSLLTKFYDEIKNNTKLEALGHVSEELAYLHLMTGQLEKADWWAEKSMSYYSENSFIGNYTPYSYLMKAKVLSALDKHNMAIDTLLKHMHKASGHDESMDKILSHQLNYINDPNCLVEYLYDLANNYFQLHKSNNSESDISEAVSYINYCHQLLYKLIIKDSKWDTRYLLKDLQKNAYALKKEIHFKALGENAIVEIDKMRNIGLEATYKTKKNETSKVIDKNTANKIINYSIIGDSLYAFIITNNKVQKHITLGKYSIIKDRIANFLNSIYEREHVDEICSELRDYLVSPINNYEGSITLVTEGDLALIPFDILFNDGTVDKTSVINYQLTSSGNQISSSPKITSSITGLFEYHDYTNKACLNQHPLYSNLDALTFAEEENIQISALLNNETRPLSKEEFKYSLENNRTTHFSGHTFSSDHHYNLNYLLLNCEDNDIYTMDDIRNTKIKNEMVVLSACNTGNGTLIESDGILSLGREFMYAGAKSVVSTLWSVNDRSTSIIMTEFYKELQKGKRKDVALRQAKLNYLESVDPEYQHPYYWAGFIAMGDMSPLFYPKRKWYYGGFALIGIFLIGFMYNKKITSSRLAA